MVVDYQFKIYKRISCFGLIFPTLILSIIDIVIFVPLREVTNNYLNLPFCLD